MSNRATSTTTIEYTANTPYSEAAYVRITLESLEDATLAWHELIDTLAYLADMTGARANTKGLRNADAEAIPLSPDIGSVGEIYVRAAALARCYNLADALSPTAMTSLIAAQGASHE